MPVPRFVGRINRRFLNQAEIRKGKRPVLHHVGRSSGVSYRTPLDAHPVEDGYVFILMYGPKSDWVRNIMATGKATLDVDGETVALERPRVVSTAELPADVKRPAGFLNVSQLLRMDRAA